MPIKLPIELRPLEPEALRRLADIPIMRSKSPLDILTSEPLAVANIRPRPVATSAAR